MPLLGTRGVASARGYGLFGRIPGDPFFSSTTLLLPGNGTNGAQNNTFLDSSTNNFTITRNGNTTQGTFSPFPQTGWSNYFNGNSLGFSDTSNLLDLGGAAASLELFIYPDVANTHVVFGKHGGTSNWSTATGFEYQVQYIGGIFYFYYNSSGSPVAVTDSVSRAANQWYHVAVATDASNNISFYINGTRVATATNGITKPTSRTNIIIGVDIGGNYTYGYISNLRFVTGSNAINPSSTSITVPTAAVSAVTGTQLLTCQSNRFVDNSSNAFALTVTGSPSVQAFSPFNPTAAYSAAANGGSGYFDGSGDYLTAANNPAFAFGTGDFTVEYWAYSQDVSTPAERGTLQTSDTVGGLKTTYTTGIMVAQGVGGNGKILANVAGTSISSATAPLVVNTWQHIAIVRNSGTVTIYVNGTSVASGTASGNCSGEYLAVGGYYSTAYLFNGYLSSLRIVKGTAVYTANFTPPTAPLTAITNTSLLLNFTNAGIFDATAKNDLETVGNAQISTAQSKWGGASIAFDGTGDYLSSQNVLTANFGSGPFTAELWIYFNNASGTQYALSNYQNSSIGWGLGISSGNFAFWATGDTPDISTSTPAATGTWYHLAVSGQSGAIRLFLNGTQIGSTFTGTPSLDSTLPLRVGDGQGAASPLPLNGYIDDLRITKGVARYTASFTAPTAAFPLY